MVLLPSPLLACLALPIARQAARRRRWQASGTRAKSHVCLPLRFCEARSDCFCHFLRGALRFWLRLAPHLPALQRLSLRSVPCVATLAACCLSSAALHLPRLPPSYTAPCTAAAPRCLQPAATPASHTPPSYAMATLVSRRRCAWRHLELVLLLSACPLLLAVPITTDCMAPSLSTRIRMHEWRRQPFAYVLVLSWTWR